MKKALPIFIMLVLMGGNAQAGWLDRYCAEHPNSSYCASDEEPSPEPATTALTEVEAVPYLSDETATYVFKSTVAGKIVYGGACGNADVTQAVAGNNTITWTLPEGTYSNCTIKVGDSNTLTVPAFKSTSKYPVVFVHGLGGSSSAWNNAKAYLTSQGWDSSLLIAKSMPAELNSTLCGDISPNQAAEVGEWVDDALEQFPGFTKIDLVAHSRGGSNVMRGLWHGYIDPATVRHVVTLAGANRACAPYYPAIPKDETPGSIKFSCYYSDGTPDYDTAVNYSTTNIQGAYLKNLWPLSHSQIKTDTASMQAVKNSLLGVAGSN